MRASPCIGAGSSSPRAPTGRWAGAPSPREAFSLYHNVEAGHADYPKLLITTSTRDDRVHPGHARMMAAKMLAMGHDVLYHENVEGGRAGAADNELPPLQVHSRPRAGAMPPVDVRSFD